MGQRIRVGGEGQRGKTKKKDRMGKWERHRHQKDKDGRTKDEEAQRELEFFISYSTALMVHNYMTGTDYSLTS